MSATKASTPSLDWETTTLGSVCSKPQYGWTTSAVESGEIKLLRTTDITSGQIDWNTVPFCRDAPPNPEKYLLADGDIVVSRAGSVGVSHRVVAPKRAVFASYLIRFRPKPSVDGKYLAYYLQSPTYWSLVRGSTSGIAVPNVNASKLEAFSVPLAPIEEQRRIVAEIEKQFARLEAGMAALKRVQANLKRYRAAVLKSACEGPWHRKPLGEIADVRLGKMLDKAKHVSGRKLSYLRNVNVRWGKIETTDLLEMCFEDDEMERYGLKAGDVLVCEGGEPGRASVWKGLLSDLKYQKALHRVRFDIPFEPYLLVYLLEWLAKTGGLDRRFTGSTIKHFTRESFVELPVPVPPLAEQTRIVAEVERRLSVVEELEAVAFANLQRATRLRQSILQRAFVGELTTE